MDPEDARIYIATWVTAISDDELARMDDDEAIALAEQHWAMYAEPDQGAR